MKNTIYSLGFAALISPAIASGATDPTDLRVASPSNQEASVYADYVPQPEIKLQSWQAANAEAAQAPGHAGHGAAPASSSMHGSNHDMASPQGDMKQAKPDTADEHAGHNMTAPAPQKADKPVAERTRTTSSAAPAASALQAEPAKAKSAAPAAGAGIVASGNVLAVDKPNGKVKVTHDPIPQIGWPKMTMYFRVKDPALLDRVTEGPTQFVLEKSGSGYVISDFKK